MNLRPYQQESIGRVEGEWARGIKSTLLVLPTGAGKTVVFATIIKRHVEAEGGRWLVLAHRTELLEQARDKINAIAPGIWCEIEQASSRAGMAGVVVGSVQTLRGERLESWPRDAFAGVVIDESHHASSASYRKILDHFSGAQRILGVTATPNRSDGVALGEVFETIAHEVQLLDLIDQGYLAPITAYKIRTGVSLDGVKMSGGDFQQQALAEAIDTDERNALIAGAFQRHAEGRKAIAFCASVDHSERLCATFEAVGVPARHVDGSMVSDARRGAIDWLKDAPSGVICNCQVLTEGFDEPSVNCILMARPTKSGLLYAQMLGRGTRLSPGKENLLVLDFFDENKHTLSDSASLLGLPSGFDLQGKPSKIAREKLRKLEQEHPYIDVGKIRSLAEIDTALERADLFRSKTPAELAKFTKLNWSKCGDGYGIGIPKEGTVYAKGNLLGQFEVFHRRGNESKKILTCKTIDEAINAGDAYVAINFPSAVSMLKSSAPWRKNPASEKQIALLRKLRVRFPPEITCGQASAMIDARLRRF